MAKIKPEFDRRGVKVIGLSVDPVAKHADWARDIEETQGSAPNYPIIGDAAFNVAKLTTGRNFDEVLRVIDSLQLTAEHKVSTPANWHDGEESSLLARSQTTRRRRSSVAGRSRSPTSASSRGQAEGTSRRHTAAGSPRPAPTLKAGLRGDRTASDSRGSARSVRSDLATR
jgi:hypothetical protein